ncbi:MAG: glucoamylase family protein [Burkholderiaceae bacterium]
MAEVITAIDEALLNDLQQAAFSYFLQAVNPANGLVADNSRADSPCSIAVVGFALAAYPIAVQRGWMTRSDAVTCSLATLRFFHESDQSDSPRATGYKGFYYHFLDMQTGRRVWNSELSMIDTGLMIAGALTAAMYFTADTAEERELRDLADALYRRIDWRWSQNGNATIGHGWKPDSEFLNYSWDGYSEALLMYVLALGSPTHAIGEKCYEGWTCTYQWENLYGYDFLYAGPLFMHQFSHAWIDFRGIADHFMREKRCDYFENSRRAVEVQREYARRNPLGFTGYDEDCWGFSASEGPSDADPSMANEPRSLLGYAARGVPYGPDDGTLSGSAVLASLPFDPEATWSAVRTMLQRYPKLRDSSHDVYRCSGGFNPSYGGADGPWVSDRVFGLDQGIVTMMIENYRTQLIWRLMRGCPYIVDGLKRAGFSGGWL